MQNYPNHFGLLLKAARLEMGYTEKMLAEQIDVSSRFIYLLESGEKNPSMVTLIKLVRVLNINPVTIFYPEYLDKNSQEGELLRLASLCNGHDKSNAALDLLREFLSDLLP